MLVSEWLLKVMIPICFGCIGQVVGMYMYARTEIGMAIMMVSRM